MFREKTMENFPQPIKDMNPQVEEKKKKGNNTLKSRKRKGLENDHLATTVRTE